MLVITHGVFAKGWCRRNINFCAWTTMDLNSTTKSRTQPWFCKFSHDHGKSASDKPARFTLWLAIKRGKWKGALRNCVSTNVGVERRPITKSAASGDGTQDASHWTKWCHKRCHCSCVCICAHCTTDLRSDAWLCAWPCFPIVCTAMGSPVVTILTGWPCGWPLTVIDPNHSTSRGWTGKKSLVAGPAAAWPKIPVNAFFPEWRMIISPGLLMPVQYKATKSLKVLSLSSETSISSKWPMHPMTQQRKANTGLIFPVCSRSPWRSIELSLFPQLPPKKGHCQTVSAFHQPKLLRPSLCWWVEESARKIACRLETKSPSWRVWNLPPDWPPLFQNFPCSSGWQVRDFIYLKGAWRDREMIFCIFTTNSRVKVDSSADNLAAWDFQVLRSAYKSPQSRSYYSCHLSSLTFKSATLSGAMAWIDHPNWRPSNMVGTSHKEDNGYAKCVLLCALVHQPFCQLQCLIVPAVAGCFDLTHTLDGPSRASSQGLQEIFWAPSLLLAAHSNIQTDLRVTLPAL